MKRINIEDIEAFIDHAEELEKENERLKRIEAAAKAWVATRFDWGGEDAGAEAERLAELWAALCAALAEGEDG